MATAKEILKGWFSNFKKPTQNQFWAWIESYWHKDEKIPIDSVEGLKSALENTANADMINNHLTDTQAHKALFDKKVDKENGKGLSSNDYTDEEKARNTENEKWRAVGMSVTGEANKTITLTFKNGEVLTAPFVDITGGGAGPDVKLNSLAFDPTTGVLTGNRSDGTPITVNLDGRYALLRHTHNINDLNNIDGLDNKGGRLKSIGSPQERDDATPKWYVDDMKEIVEIFAGQGDLKESSKGKVMLINNPTDITIDGKLLGKTYLSFVSSIASPITFNFLNIQQIVYANNITELTGAGSTAAVIIYGEEGLRNAIVIINNVQ